MAELNRIRDRKDWLTWAIEFVRRGLWLGEEITVHGPHDSSLSMWGEASARLGLTREEIDCSFVAIANGSKFRPGRVRIVNTEDKDERFPVLKESELTPKAQKWLHAARRTLHRL
jgi:hypothetical protein